MPLEMPRPVWAQGAVTLGTITGYVVDSSGAGIPNAGILVEGKLNGLRRWANSDEQGYFSITQIPIGSYDLHATKQAFKESILTRLILDAGAVNSVTLVLEIGDIQQREEVRADSAKVDITQTDVSSAVTEQQLRDLPVNQRSFTALVTQQAGFVQMTNTPPPSPTSTIFSQGSLISANGRWASSIAYLMDGVPLRDSRYGAPGTAAGGDAPGLAAVQEFRVLAHDYSAAYGGAAGGVVSFSTRGGSNAWDASLYEYLRNSDLDSRGPFDLLNVDRAGKATVPPFRRNQFGNTFSGPLKRDRTFFFANYEGLRQSLATTDIATVPTAAARAGGLGGSSGFQVLGPVPQANGTYRNEPVAISAGVQAILQLYPLPNGRDFGNGTAQLLFADQRPGFCSK